MHFDLVVTTRAGSGVRAKEYVHHIARFHLQLEPKEHLLCSYDEAPTSILVSGKPAGMLKRVRRKGVVVSQRSRFV